MPRLVRDNVVRAPPPVEEEETPLIESAFAAGRPKRKAKHVSYKEVDEHVDDYDNENDDNVDQDVDNDNEDADNENYDISFDDDFSDSSDDGSVYEDDDDNEKENNKPSKSKADIACVNASNVPGVDASNDDEQMEEPLINESDDSSEDESYIENDDSSTVLTVPPDEDEFISEDSDNEDGRVENTLDEFGRIAKDHWRGLEWDDALGKFRFDSTSNPNAQNDMPKADQWKKESPREMTSVKVTFEGAGNEMIGAMKASYDAFLEQLAVLEVDPSTRGLYFQLFGQNSRLSTVMRKNLGISHEQFAQFMSTFYYAAEWGRPAARLEKHDRFNYEGLMPQEQFNAIWLKIANAGKDGKKEKLWMALQAALNADCRELFLSQQVNRFIALDDDKVRFQFSTESVRADKNALVGIKACQHVKANCRGFVFDTAVDSVTGFPLCLSLLRAGETNFENYQRIVDFMYEHLKLTLSSAALATMLSGITFCSDRGYWKASLILYLLGLGATVFGTLMRMDWVPYTYDQVLKESDKRVRIEKKYGRSAFVAYSRCGLDMVKVIAWRPGTGNAVSLAMTSDCDESEPQQFDFHFKRNGDAKWYKSDLSQDERNLKAFPGSLLSMEDEDAESVKNLIDYHLQILAMNNVLMLNCSDHTIEWFVLRMLSITSSVAEQILKSIVPFIPKDSEAYSDFKTVFSYAGIEDRLSSPQQDSELDDDLDDIDASLVAKIISSMRSPTQHTVIECTENARRIDSALSNCDSPRIERIMLSLGFSRDRIATFTHDDNIKTIKKWTKSIINCATRNDNDDDNDDAKVPYEFPYNLLSAKEIESLLMKRVGPSKISSRTVPGPFSNPTKKGQRLAALRWLDENPDAGEARQRSEPVSESAGLQHAIISGVVSRAFLKGLDGQEKASARLGHQNEQPYIEQYFKDSKEGKVPDVKLLDVRRCGLASKRGYDYVRDSADALAFEERDLFQDFDTDNDEYFDRIKSHPVECKCRSGAGSDGSLKKALRIQKQIANLIGTGDAHAAIKSGQAVYLHVSSQDKHLLRDLIPSAQERIQCLHHAYTYGCDRVSFLVGNGQGKLLFGLVIKFEADLTESYGQALQFLYNNGLDLFYSENIDQVPLEQIEEILLQDQKLKSKFTLDDFMFGYLVWRELLPERPNSPKFPIPACHMGLPYEHSLWDGCKGGSDTVTRFAWNCISVLPIKAPQASVVARLFLVYAVAFHRARQVVTMTKPVDPSTDTVQSVRERNNQRMSFHQTLNFTAKHLCKTSNAIQNAVQAKHVTVVEVKEAEKYSKSKANKRYKTNKVLEARTSTGATPVGRGKKKMSLENHECCDDYLERAKTCLGVPFRCYTQVIKKTKKNQELGVFSLRTRDCDLCGKRAVSFMCAGPCKRALCFDKDRSEAILKRLSNDKIGPILRERFPALASLSRNDVPAFYCSLGRIRGQEFFAGMSCFDIAHPERFNQSLQEEEQDLVQLSAVAASGASASSPGLS